MNTLVERMLPAEFLFKQGVYLQTCAHIELALWHIVQLADGHDIGKAPGIEAYLKLKKRTPILVAAVSKAAGLVPAALGVRLAALAARTEAGLVNRNMAAHGAWHTEPNSDKLHVEHYLTLPTASGSQWHYVSRPFSAHEIDLAIQDCDLILREAVAIRIALEALSASRKRLAGWRPRLDCRSLTRLDPGGEKPRPFPPTEV